MVEGVAVSGCRSYTPIASAPGSVNQTFPSAPKVSSCGDGAVPGIENAPENRCLDVVMFCNATAAWSMYQMSPPVVVIPFGSAPEEIAYSVTTPAGVIRPTEWLGGSVNQTLWSCPSVTNVGCAG